MAKLTIDTPALFGGGVLHYAAFLSAKRAAIQSSISDAAQATDLAPVIFTGRGKSDRLSNS